METKSETRGRPELVRGLTLLGAIAFVVGNMAGTSIYTLPATLAGAVGPLGIVAWAVCAAGFLPVALVYADVGRRWRRTGGPYVVVREVLGDFAGFQTVWAYWLSATIGNAGIAVAVVGYAQAFVPALAESAWLRFGAAQALVWALVAVNVRGVRESARLQIAILALNVVPLAFVAFAALGSFDAANLEPFAPNGWTALPAGVALVVWAFSGVESATVPAEEVAAPERTIRRGTLVGYAVASALFLVAALATAGGIPNGELAGSEAPIAALAERSLGTWAARAVAVASIVSGVGTLNGWILIAGRIPVAAAEDGLFFPSLGRIDARTRTPRVALLVGGAIASLMLFQLLAKTLLGAFAFVVQFAVLTTLLPHVFVAASAWLLARREAGGRASRREVAPALAFAFLLFTIYGVGGEVTLWGLLAVLAGTPLYVALRARAVAA